MIVDFIIEYPSSLVMGGLIVVASIMLYRGVKEIFAGEHPSYTPLIEKEWKRIPLKEPHYSSDLEKVLHEALYKRGIHAVHESQGDTGGLDFYLPGFGVYLEVKAFHADRISTQMKSQRNVVAIQGSDAVNLVCGLLGGGVIPDASAKRSAALKSMVENDTPLTRVDYLIASIEDISKTCADRGEYGSCCMLDNLIRIAEDVKLGIQRNLENEE